MSKVLYLFNSKGEWIAFRIGNMLYNKNANWIGWFPWKNNIAVTTEGEYLGTIYRDRILLYDLNQPYLGYPGYPGYSGYPGYPGYPGYIGYVGLLAGTKDVPKDFLKEDENE